MGLFYNFEAFGLLPGISGVSENIVNAVTWGPWEHNRAFVVPTLLDGASRDPGNEPTDLLRPGLLMGMVAATRKAKPYDGAGIDGTEALYGILIHDVKLTANDTDYDRWFGFILVGGNIKSSSLIDTVPGATPGSWVGGANDGVIRSHLINHFITDDFGWNG